MANKGMELSQAKEALQQKAVELEAAKSAVEKAEFARDIFLAKFIIEFRCLKEVEERLERWLSREEHL